METAPPDLQLTRVEMKNILSFKHTTFDEIGQSAIVIGKNNSRKSNLLKALLNLQFNAAFPEDFFFTDAGLKDAEIRLDFKLATQALSKLSNIFHNSCSSDNFIESEYILFK